MRIINSQDLANSFAKLTEIFKIFGSMLDPVIVLRFKMLDTNYVITCDILEIKMLIAF